MGTEVINTSYNGEVDKYTKDIVLNKISEAMDRALSYVGECTLSINITMSNKDNTFDITTNTSNTKVAKPVEDIKCPVTEYSNLNSYNGVTEGLDLLWRKELTDLDKYGIGSITNALKHIATWYLQRYEHSSGPMFSPNPNNIPIALRNLRKFIKYLHNTLGMCSVYGEAASTIDMYEEDIKYKLNRINYKAIEKNFVKELRKLIKQIS